MPYQIEYFNPRVLSQIEEWPVETLADYYRLTEMLGVHGPNLRMPHSRAMEHGLFELRARGGSGIGRAFYCFVRDSRITVLHAFVKRTQKTPAKELKVAKKRMKEVEKWLT